MEKVPGLFSVVFPDESAFTYEQFAWAASIVWSRNFRIRVKDGSGQWQSANCKEIVHVTFCRVRVLICPLLRSCSYGGHAQYGRAW